MKRTVYTLFNNVQVVWIKQIKICEILQVRTLLFQKKKKNTVISFLTNIIRFKVTRSMN